MYILMLLTGMFFVSLPSFIEVTRMEYLALLIIGNIWLVGSLIITKLKENK